MASLASTGPPTEDRLRRVRRGSIALAVLAAAMISLAAPSNARADGCDGVIARLIRETGASFAGRAGALAVFRAADAERMSLVCGRSPEMVFRSAYRAPNRYYFVLIGLSGHALLGARAQGVEALALALHQAAVETGQPQAGIVGPVLLRCDASPALDLLTPSVLCRLAPAPRGRRAELFAARAAG